MANEIQTYLKYANLQMAAEAIYSNGFTSGAIPESTLKTGNNRSSKFTETQAADFASTSKPRVRSCNNTFQLI